jgi:hypothetical protein
MAVNINNQLLEDIYTGEITSNVRGTRSGLSNYTIFASALSTGIRVSPSIKYDGYVKISSTTRQEGYRIDIADAKTALQVGQLVTITGSPRTNYSVNSLVTPELDKTTGKIVSFTDISDTPISVDSTNAVRNYQINISINISDI